MSEELNWGDVMIDSTETVTADDQAQSEDIDLRPMAGEYLCTMTKVKPIQKDFKAYSCYAANITFRIDKVLKIEKPVIADGKPVVKDGEKIMKVQPVTETEGFDAKFSGMNIFDDIPFFHAKEKPAMKKRRLFFLKKAGVITNKTTNINGEHFQNCQDRQIIVKTENNSYTKDGITKTNVKVSWGGFERASMAGVKEDDFSGI